MESNKPYHEKIKRGGSLIIWDRLFGTYKTEQRKVVYRINTPYLVLGISLVINFYECWKDHQRHSED